MRNINQLMDLSGRKALISGGAGHIGRTAASTLLELGANVVILDLDDNACQEAADSLASPGQETPIPVTCDLTDEQSTRDAIRRSSEKMGGLDIIVHCAAYIGDTNLAGWTVPFEEQSVDSWDAALRVNLTSAFVMVQEGQKPLVASGHGSVILLGSIYGLIGPDMRLYSGTDMGNPGGYAASKGGIIQITKYLATILAPSVRVNAISPGGVWREQPDSFHKQYISRTPMNRMATEEDLKGAVAYLASDLSAYVTGHNLVVDGGWTTW